MAAAFRPGADADTVRAALESEGVPPHEDLVAWWHWHDGAASGASPIESGPGIYFSAENALAVPWHVLSVGDALRIRRWLRETHVAAGLGHLLPPTWVPVLTTDGAGDLCADAGVSGPAPLHVFDEGHLEPPPVLFASLEELVRLLVRAFDEGLVVSGPQDPRAPAIAAAALDTDLRRLVRW